MASDIQKIADDYRNAVIALAQLDHKIRHAQNALEDLRKARALANEQCEYALRKMAASALDDPDLLKQQFPFL